MPKRRYLNAIERDGVNYVRNIIEHANSIFNEIHRKNDYGNDGFIELVDGENVTGKCLLVQIKSGKSYNSDSSCSIPASAEHFIYWQSHKLPVIGIVYDPTEECGYWINISSFLNRNPSNSKNGPYQINFPKQPLNRFDHNRFREFFLPIFLGKPIIIDFDKSVEFALSEDFDMHSIGIQSLFYGYRNEERTWDIFESILIERPADRTTGYLAYIFAHIPGHGDIFWHKNNIIDDEISKNLKKRFQLYSQEILVPLLRLVDENSFERGSVGQNVYAIIDIAVSNSSIKLSKIIKDETIESKTRTSALLIYCFIEQENAETLLKKIDDQDPELKEFATYLLDVLKREGFFYT